MNMTSYFFLGFGNWACLKTLARVSGPIIARMAGNSDATSLKRVLILAMATFLGKLIPAVFFYKLQQFPIIPKMP